jgi:uncharacterized protein (TIGR02466 family)
MEYQNGQFKNIFPTTIYEAEYPNFQDIKKQLLADLEPHFSSLAAGNQYWDKDNNPLIYRTLPNLEQESKFKHIIDFVEYHGKKYWKGLNYTSRVEPYVLHMWSNRIPPGGHTPVHVHTPMPVAAAFYVHASDEMGVLEIENPIDTIEKLQPRDNRLNPYFHTHEVSVKDGKLVLFPGWMRHFTRSNTSKENRIVISCNIGANVTYHPMN